MKKNIQSIRSRLLIWLSIPLSIFTIILFVYIYFLVNQKVNDFFDKTLYATGKSIEDSIGIEEGVLGVDLPYFAIDLLSSNGAGLIFYSVVANEDNRLLVGHENLFNKDVLKEQDKVFYNTVYTGVTLRAVSFKTSIIKENKVYYSSITIAESVESRVSTINDILSSLFIILFSVVFFTIIISLIAVKKGLYPLYLLQKLILKRDSRDLKTIHFDAPKELEEILNSINILLERSRDNIEYIEHFNSDVSHQLRTPLAEIKVRLELMYEKDNKEYISLLKLVNSMSHITEQLLLYAKSNPNSINLKRFKKENLRVYCKNYGLRIATKIYAQGFEFAYESFSEDVFIDVDTIMLDSMLDNIINNALYYARDEKNKAIGTITLCLEKHHETIWIKIKDQGKGLNKKELKHIFDRFYRVDSFKRGSGLGLSIVKQIALLHNAKVEARSDKGLEISIIFPYLKS
ncbi:MAG: hypothetical protein COA66_01070 [Arcobacter sp.]|nr:MAG: hypothetical protein COA66_01070 [Arcobacter sp.]